MTLEDGLILGDIRETRADNNELWMRIMEIALRVSPDETKQVLRQIHDNDAQNLKNLKELAA